MYKDNIRELFSLLKDHEIIVFDTETSGFSSKTDFILSFSGLRLKYDMETKKFKETGRLDVFMKPSDDFRVPAKVSAVNHITTESLADKPLEKDAMQQVRDFLGKNPIIVGHNVAFDIRFTDAAYERVFGSKFQYKFALDTLKVAKEIVSKDQVPDYQLSTLVDTFGVAGGLEFHNSIDDVITTTRILEKLLLMFIKSDGDTIPTDKQKVSVLGITAWKRYSYHRLYIQNNRAAYIYYDVDKKNWIQRGGEPVDLDDIESQCLKKTGCKDMDQISRKISFNE